MIRLNVHEAKTHLSKYLGKLERDENETIVLCRRNKPIAEMRALPRENRKPRPIGMYKGQIEVPDSFFESLPPEIMKYFTGEDE